MDQARNIRLEGDAIGSALITGSGNTVNVQFGLTSAPRNFLPLIRRFLEDYLGSTPSTPVPFGGRKNEIDRLNRWLADPEGRGNLLVTAPAGRGKTALLVRWMSQADPESWPIVFVPISIRYETNRATTFYQALAARLAEVLNEKLPTTPADPAPFYRDKVIEYLDLFHERNQRCLVVIDGLDEAAGWQVDTSVLPRNPAPGLRIVASARVLAGDTGPVDWLRRIGWTSGSARIIDVPPLDRDQIADVLRNMGVPLADLTGDVDILSELLRLTTGDPLLVSLYVEELWENRHSTHGLRPEDLSSMEPGFAAFFKRWWEEQRRAWRDAGAAIDEDLTQAILAVLACALGPIRFVELERLVREVHAVSTVFSVDSLRPIERLVIGNGRVVGYSLSHPKLAEYFRNEHFRGGEVIRRTQAAFIEWGRSTVRALNAGALSPSSDPDYAYLLNHYSQHWLASAGTKSHPSERVEALLEFVADGWRQAWEAYEGGFQGFAGDVRTAWDAVRQIRRLNDRQSGTTHLGVEVRCALCLSSICSMGSNIPANLLALAVACDTISIQQARHIADLKGGEPENRLQAMMALAPYLPETEKLALLEDIRALSDEEARSRALIQMAGYLPAGEGRHSVLAEARSLALQSQRPQAVASLLSLLLPLLSDNQDRIALASKGLRAAEQVDDGLTRALLLADIAFYLLPDEASAARTQAINAARSTTGPERAATALADLALRLPEQDPRRSKLCREAIEVADRVLRELNGSDPYQDFHMSLAVAARACALALLSRGEPDSQRRSEFLDLSESTARSLPSEYFRVSRLTSLIPHLPETRRAAILEEALQLARTLPTGNNRTHAFGALAVHLSPDRQREVVLEALSAARLIEDEYGRFLTFVRIAKQTEGWVSSAAVARATALIRSGIGYVIHRADALRALAPFLGPFEQRRALTEALRQASQSPYPQFRIPAIINLIPQLPQDLQQVAIRHVLDARSGDPFRALHLVALVEAVPDTLKQPALIISMNEIQNSSLQFREEALLELAKFLKGEQQRDLLSESRRWIDGLDKASERVRQCAKLESMTHNPYERNKLVFRLEHEIDQIHDSDEKSTVLVDLVAVLPISLRSRFFLRAYDAAKSCTSPAKKAHNLAKLAPYLHEPEKSEAAALSFEAARSIDQRIARLQALRAVAPLLHDVQRREAVDLLLDSCAHLQRGHTVEVLGHLPVLLPKEDHAAVLLPAMAALHEMAEWFP